MLFGLKNAPAIFQEVVEEVLSPVSGVCKNYIDDVVAELESLAIVSSVKHFLVLRVWEKSNRRHRPQGMSGSD